MEVKCFIYKITSPSKKVYIGSTKNLSARISAYKRHKCNTQTRLYNSFVKYGFDKHKFEIITECSLEDMLRLECYYGNLYNSLGKNGLNCVLPNKDDKFICRSEETRIKISISNTGKKLSEETKQKLRDANLGKPSPLKGKSFHTNESKQKMRLSHTGKKLTQEHKNKISAKNKGRTPKNFYEIKEKLKKKVILVDSNLIFNSIKEAGDYLKISPFTLSGMLNNRRKNKFNIHFYTNN